MKKSILILTFLLFSFATELMAQKVNQGVYLSAKDFTNCKISFVNNQLNKKYRFRLHEIFNTSTVKLIIGDSVIKLNKDSIFGYHNKRNTCYRFYNKVAFKIINPTEKILLYSQTSTEGGHKSSRIVTNYFFSEDAGSPIYALSKWNVKTVFFKDISFLQLLDVYFDNDKELTAFDSINKIYMLNRVYELNQQKSITTINNLIGVCT